MSAFKILSEYQSDNSTRRSTVMVELGNEQTPYSVSVINDSGTSFRVSFSNQSLAEDFAEDWVLDK